VRIVQYGREKYAKIIQYPLKHECKNCGSVLIVDENDVKWGYLGQAYVDCPVCHRKSYLEIDGLDEDITVDNLVFPDHFWYFGDKDAKELTSDEIKECIKEAIEFFRKNPDNFCYMTGSGDTAVFVLNYPGDENYSITVCKGYYETEIAYTEEDYELDREALWENKGIDRRKKHRETEL